MVNMELNLYCIFPLYMTATFKIWKSSCSFRNKISRFCCILKTTNKTEPNLLKNTSISWYDIKASGIYWNNKDAWHKVLL